MKNVDYCYSVFGNGEDLMKGFTAPREIETALGKAVRNYEEGSFIWSDNIRVRQSTGDGLSLWLPVDRRTIKYTTLDIEGAVPRGGMVREDGTISEANEAAVRSFIELIRYICERSSSWAIFVLAYCDDIETRVELDLADATVLLNRFIFEKSDDLDSGFCIISA